MSVKIDYLPESPNRNECAFCPYAALFMIHSSKVAGIYKSCGGLDCQKKGTDQMKARVALVSSGDDKPAKKEKKRERDIPHDLDGIDYSTLMELPTEDLELMCQLRMLPKSGTKGQRAQRLLDWRDNGQRSEKEVRDSYRSDDVVVSFCIAMRKDGSDCTSKAVYGGLYCRRHIH